MLYRTKKIKARTEKAYAKKLTLASRRQPKWETIIRLKGG